MVRTTTSLFLTWRVFFHTRMNSTVLLPFHLVVSMNAFQNLFIDSFSEFGVFINSAGRQTRQKTLMWTRLPLAFGKFVFYKSLNFPNVIFQNEKLKHCKGNLG